MLVKLVLFITILTYAFVVGQSLFYMLALSNVTKKMNAPVYIATRQLLDAEIKPGLKLAYYLSLTASLVLTTLSFSGPGYLLFICSLASVVALAIDMILAVKGNVPLNKSINTWTISNYPDDWQEVRTRWFDIYHTRQGANITGFIFLLAGCIFGL